MEWQFVVALVLGIPVILVPAALIWSLDSAGLFEMAKGARARARKAALVAR